MKGSNPTGSDKSNAEKKTGLFLPSFVIYRQKLGSNSLWPCMVRKILWNKKKRTTSSNSFSNKSSGCHTLWYNTGVRDMLDNLTIEAGWRSATKANLRNAEMFSILFSASHDRCRPLLIFLHQNVRFSVRWALKKKKKCCPEGCFIATSTFYRSQNLHLWAVSRKIANSFCFK